MTEPKNVCNGCWTRGVCVKQLAPEPWKGVCTCPCEGGTVWRHTDDPREVKN